MNDVVGLNVNTAEVVMGCAELNPSLEFFTQRLGFVIELIFPADDPQTAVINGHGVRIRLDRAASTSPGGLVLRCSTLPDGYVSGDCLEAPNGCRIQLIDMSATVALPPNVAEFVLMQAGEGGGFGTGRAGMMYRDLIPNRQGGRFIASHIRIPEGGPVPDYVHYHKVRFQMIYCHRGWVRVVYEGQGEPFVMYPGDCVIQPPEIRHRVLESSDGLEVVELGCPAEHETWVDHQLELPNGVDAPTRAWDGQAFIRHQANETAWSDWRHAGFEARDVGIGAATKGLAGARTVRACQPNANFSAAYDAEFIFGFVLCGTAKLTCLPHASDVAISTDDAFVIPGATAFKISECSADFEWLDVTLPGSV